MRLALGPILVSVLALAPAIASANERDSDSALRAGAAIVDITPKQGVSLDGSIIKRGPVLGIHDRLHVRAIVLDDGETRLAIAVVDACMVGRDVYDAAKQIVEKKIGLAPEHMLMVATHTHAAVRLIHVGKGPLDDAYHERVSRQIAKAIVTAAERLAPAQIGFGSFEKPEFLACRRKLCKPGTAGPNPYGATDERIDSVAARSRNIIKPAGPIDPQFSIFSVQHTDGTPLAVLGNYSVHYCGGYARGQVSADYFGYYARAMQNALAHEGSEHPPVVGIMSNGTSGNTGGIRRVTGKSYPAFGWMEAAGQMLAEESLQAMESIDAARSRRPGT